jgi:hypothetical protein
MAEIGQDKGTASIIESRWTFKLIHYDLKLYKIR